MLFDRLFEIAIASIAIDLPLIYFLLSRMEKVQKQILDELKLRNNDEVIKAFDNIQKNRK